MAGLIMLASPALATQGHGEPEGLWVHQMSHIFFALSMGILIYWLRVRTLVRETGWRYIQYSAILFILWTIDAFTVHLLEEQLGVVAPTKPTPWTIEVASTWDAPWLCRLYYVAKLDHLFCVPALFFLYLGLKRLLRKAASPGLAERMP
jgi:hypothetical protein